MRRIFQQRIFQKKLSITEASSFFVIIQHPLEKLMIQSDKVTNLTDLSGRGRE